MNKEDYFKYYIQGSDHYLIPKDVFKELFNEIINWKEESKKQKEVISRAIKILDIIIYDLEEHEEALPPTKEELCKVFGILKEVSE